MYSTAAPMYNGWPTTVAVPWGASRVVVPLWLLCTTRGEGSVVVREAMSWREAGGRAMPSTMRAESSLVRYAGPWAEGAIPFLWTWEPIYCCCRANADVKPPHLLC